MKFKAAAIQYEPKFLDKTYNLGQLLFLTEKAAEEGARLIVLPEMCTSGYYFDNRGEIEALAEEIPAGPTTSAFAALSKNHDCYIVAGIAERDGTKLYNSSFLVGPEGFIGRYRKIHPFWSDCIWAKNGDEPMRVYTTPLGNIAILVCMDVSFPETVRVCKAMGADIICVPMNWYERLMPSGIWITRAYENGVYFIAANRYGKEKTYIFGGESCIINPCGELLAVKKEGDCIVMGEIDSSLPGELPVSTRQRQMYAFLQCNPYRWPGNATFNFNPNNRLPEGEVFKAGIAQFVPEGKDNNLAIIKEIILKAAKQHVRYLVLPEFALTGEPGLSQNAVQKAAQIALDENDELIQQLQKMAQDNQIHLVCGLVLAQDGSFYNAAVYIPPHGQCLFYKKSHLNEQDKLWADYGRDAPLIIDAPGARLGILIGDELQKCELPRLAANHAADMIMAPSAVSKYRSGFAGSAAGENHWHLARIRANENNSYVLFANSLKGSGIFGPDMFVNPRQETIIANDNLATMEIDTRPIITRDDRSMGKVNKVREKPMLATRQEFWYNTIFEQTN